MNDEFGTFSYGEDDSKKEKEQQSVKKKSGWTPEPYREQIYSAPNYQKLDYSRQAYLNPARSRFDRPAQQTQQSPYDRPVQQTQQSPYDRPAQQTQQRSPYDRPAEQSQSYTPASSGYGRSMNNSRQTYGSTAGSVPSTPKPASDEHTPKTPDVPKKKKSENSLGRKLLITALMGLVFGLISGGVFLGLNSGKFFGKSDDEDKTSVTTSTQGKTTESTTTATGTGQIKQQEVVDNNTGSNTISYDVANIVKKAQPSIVSITTTVSSQYQYFYQQFERESTGAGSGIIIGKTDDKLYIATNYHVIENAKEIKVGFNDGEVLVANVTGMNKNEDVAVVEIDLDKIPSETMNAISIAVPGDSDQLQVGEPAIAMGNALGFGQSVTVGYISALNRSISGSDGSYIQTDAAINPGNSGGALVNAKGEVIGINSVKYVDNTVEGMGFSIPINRAMQIIDDLIAGKSSGKVYIGISGANISSAYTSVYGFPEEGIYVKQVTNGSPADQGGMQAGDIIINLEGTRVTKMEEFIDLLQNYKAGTTVSIEVYRADSRGNYDKVTLKVVTAED